ncbi:MAG TPA: protein kinase [Terriglobia bacterium]|nr:protein kinase [Terriglobia bacterium]
MTPEQWQRIQEILDVALEAEPGARAAYLDRACDGEPSLRREVESLIAAHEGMGDFMERPAGEDIATTIELKPGSRTGERIGRYRLLEEVGRGGMGTVYRAVRVDDFEQQVAVKLVKRGLDSEFVLARFRNERQILARLDHPNIGRLLDGASTEDGLPYFVMEYVRGGTLDQYCDSRRLSITKRLRLFLAVCSAVQYAHRNLIVHRDLKPSNILVTDDGTPKLLDFGIAKILNPDSAAEGRTLTGVKLLTPEYASPEQLLGEPITTASDVYSLGVVLYELLTGHRPYCGSDRSLEAITRAISEIEPEKPSSAVTRVEEVKDRTGEIRKRVAPQEVAATREASVEKLRRRLAGDVDTIVLMAIRREPQRRYASVEQFSEDIRRHLEGLPVAARTDTFWYRSSKFTRRHRAAVAGAALVALALFVGMAATLREARIAQSQRGRAERRFNDVRKLANSLIFDIHDSIQDLPGSTPARKLLVDRGLQYLDSLAKEAAGDTSLQEELVKAYQRVGDVQGYPFGPNLGDTPGAMASYRKALAISEPLARAHPSDAGLRSDLMICYQRIGNVQSESGDVSDALQNQRKATAIAEDLAAADPSNKATQRKLFVSYSNLGDVLVQEADYKAGLEVHQKALKVAQLLYQLDPKSPQAGGDLSLCYAKIGTIQSRTGKKQDALKNYRESLSIRQALAIADPTNADYQRRLSAAYERMGDLFAEEENVAAALENQRKALAIDQSLAAADLNNVDDQLGLALSYSNVGELLEMSRKFKSAQDNYQQSVTIMEGLAAKNPANTQVPFYLADGYAELGSVAFKTGNTWAAAEKYGKATAIAQELSTRDPANADVRDKLADYYAKLGELNESGTSDLSSASQAERWMSARSWFQKSLDVRLRMAPGETADQSSRDKIDKTRRQIGKCEAALTKLRAPTAH